MLPKGCSDHATDGAETLRSGILAIKKLGTVSNNLFATSSKLTWPMVESKHFHLSALRILLKDLNNAVFWFIKTRTELHNF